MLEFKKKTRAHKWRNFAVYGLLTLSQLSKMGYYVEDFNIKIADSHSHIEIGDEHFVPGVIPIHFMILSING